MWPRSPCWLSRCWSCSSRCGCGCWVGLVRFVFSNFLLAARNFLLGVLRLGSGLVGVGGVDTRWVGNGPGFGIGMGVGNLCVLILFSSWVGKISCFIFVSWDCFGFGFGVGNVVGVGIGEDLAIPVVASVWFWCWCWQMLILVLVA